MEKSKALQPGNINCHQCGVLIADKESYEYEGNTLCEDCILTIRRPRTRKTHWQYLKSIKTGYLIPAGKKESNSE